MELESDKPIKKPYIKPTVKTYGTVEDLTKAVGKNASQSDGGTGQTDKTH